MAKGRKKDESDLVRSDGAVVLTFVNTGSRRSPPLRDYADLLRWALEYGGLSAADASRLQELAAEHPDTAAAAFTVAQEVHSTLSRIMNDRADHKAPSTKVVRELNAVFNQVAPRRTLVPGRSRMVLGWAEDADKDVYRPLWPIVWSATSLLTSEDYGRVTRCAGKDCDVLFLAKNRGPARKWCSSRSCGSPFRAQRYYRQVIKQTRSRRSSGG